MNKILILGNDENGKLITHKYRDKNNPTLTQSPMEKSIQQKANEWIENNLMRETFAKIYCGKFYEDLTQPEIIHLYESFGSSAEHPDEQQQEEAAHREVWPKQAIETIRGLSEMLEHIAQSKELFSKEFVYDMENMIEDAKFLIRTHQQ